MTAWEFNPSGDGFETETGSPEYAESSGTAPAPASESRAQPTTSVTPGLAGVATISLTSTPHDSGVCRCRACRISTEQFESWFEK
jgi:hypothetical protein